MRSLALVLIVSGTCLGAVGDNAPSVPSAYVQTHPHLPYPDNAYLDLIWANRSGGAVRIWNAANAWNSTSPGSRINMRYLLLAYLAEKRNGGPNVATYLQKIKDFSNLAGNWNLSTGAGYWDLALALSMAYDWIYADLGTTIQGSMRNSLYTMMSGFETNYSGASPYNDQFYLTGFKQMLHLVAAAAIYPDDAANSLPHLRWSMDMALNMMLPAWKQVMSGGYCGASGDSSNDCGGGWHEPWNDYEGKAEAMTQWYVTTMLSWAVASGRGVSNFFTVDNGWLKNFAYWLIYETRPDFNIEPIGDESRPYLTPEYTGTNGADLGYLDGLAAIYNDATLRGWSRLMNWGGSAPDGYEPSAWPYYTPDSSSNTSNGRTVLSPYRNFPGWGTLIWRTGWTENDSFMTIRYGDSWWSHPRQDAGAFTLFNRGPLAIQSGTYRSGSASEHFQKYAAQAISQNVILVYDPNDLYNDEFAEICHSGAGCSSPACTTASDVCEVMPNDGGQRRVGSAMGNLKWNAASNPSAVGTLSAVQGSPSDPAQWTRSREYYHLGTLIAYATGANNKYAFAAVDITAAYNNVWSRNAHTTPFDAHQKNTSNRSFRVRKAVRQFTFIPRGTAAYVVVYDQIVSTNASFTKKNLIHAINQPVTAGNAFTITRSETVTNKPFSDHWLRQWYPYLTNCPGGCTSSSTQYSYNGKLYGWMTVPAGGALNLVGGPGHEFEITDSNGTFNHNECMIGQCGFGGYVGRAGGPFTITAGSNDKLMISVDGGGAQSIGLTAGTRTAAQVVSDINAVLTGAVASVEGTNRVGLKSNSGTPGTASIGIVTVANSAYATLGFATGTYTGDAYDEGLGAVGDWMHPVNTTAPIQPGSWRIEEIVGANNLSDQFIHVMLVTSASDTNTVSTLPSTTLDAGNYTTTWKDNSDTCTYTLIQPQDGVGGTLTVQGAGCTSVIN